MTNGTGAGMIDWHNGTGMAAQSLAREQFPGLDGAGTIQQARWHRNDGIGTVARAQQMS